MIDILPLGPGVDGGDIKYGDVIAAAGRAIDARTCLDELLASRIDRRVALTVVNPSGGSREVPVRPVSQATEKALLPESGWSTAAVSSRRAAAGWAMSTRST